MDFDITNIDFSLYSKMEGKVRESRETLSDRVYLTRTEQLYHRRNSSSWLKVILIKKYIDDKEVNAWSWIEEVDREELETWVKLKKNYHQKKEPLSQEDLDKQKEEKKKINSTYYQLHKEEILARKREYNRTHREQTNAQSKRYYQAHKEQIKEYNRRYREKHSIEVNQTD